MADLVSPGAVVTITEDKIASVNSPGSIPLVFVATRENKVLSNGVSVAPGTLAANAGKLYNITSQKDLIDTFGSPVFRSVDGTIQQGDELNEYGLHAAYSYLGLANQILVVRGDINLNELEPSEEEPTSPPANGTYWFDYLNSSFGVFQANGNTINGLAWDKVNVLVPALTEVGSGPAYAPLSTYGSAGDFAVSIHGAANVLYEKIVTSWYIVGSTQWKAARQTVLTGSVGFTSSGTVGVSGSLYINGVMISVTSTNTLADIITSIGTNVTNVTASVATIGVASNNKYLRLTNTAGGDITIDATSTDGVVAALGYTESTTPGYKLIFAQHTSVPSGVHDGDIWIKTTTPNYGSSYAVSVYSSTEKKFKSVVAPLYADDVLAEVGGGYGIGKVYVVYNSTNAASPTASLVIKKMNAVSAVNAVSTTYSAPAAGVFSVRTRNSLNVTTTFNVTLAGAETAQQVADAINSAVAVTGNVSHIVATVVSGQLQVASTNGTAFDLQNVTSTPLTTMTLGSGVHSNWSALTYKATANEPSVDAAEGTLWFNPAMVVDIMVNNGNQWVGYRNMYPATDPAGVQVSSAEPTVQSTGSPLVDNDLWINSDENDAYPKLYRYLGGEWILVDNTDQTTPLGVVFGDARKDTGPSGYWLSSKTSPLTGTATAGSVLTSDLLHSNFVDPVDLQVLNPQTYPAGILLFNTRFGSNNVKVRRNAYYSDVTSYSVGTFLDSAYEAAHPGSQAAVIAYLHATPGRWVSYSGNDLQGAAYMGRNAQRACVVKSLAEQIVSNQEIRAESLYFNLLAVPGYVELFDELITLNTDRQETAFIITDVPATLTSDATSIQNWATNANNAAGNGAKGRTSMYSFAAMYYPWGLGTNVDGSEVAIPSSTIALRTYGYNDRVGYLWMSPAGTRRGVVTNASALGYISAEKEFTPVKLTRGQRDTLYTNKINPITYIPNQGNLVYGDKTLASSDTSLLTGVNVARLTCFLRWILPQLVQQFLFENHTDSVEQAAADVVSKFMTSLIGLNAIQDFAVMCNSTNNTSSTKALKQLWIDVAFVPVESINFIYIPVRLETTLS